MTDLILGLGSRVSGLGMVTLCIMNAALWRISGNLTTINKTLKRLLKNTGKSTGPFDIQGSRSHHDHESGP